MLCYAMHTSYACICLPLSLYLFACVCVCRTSDAGDCSIARARLSCAIFTVPENFTLYSHSVRTPFIVVYYINEQYLCMRITKSVYLCVAGRLSGKRVGRLFRMCDAQSTQVVVRPTKLSADQRCHSSSACVCVFACERASIYLCVCVCDGASDRTLEASFFFSFAPAIDLGSSVFSFSGASGRG